MISSHFPLIQTNFFKISTKSILSLLIFSCVFFPFNTHAVSPQLVHGAASYISQDLETKEIYVSKNSSTVRPIASMTKLMTALVAIENIPREGYITISQTAYNTLGNWAGLKLGDSFLRDDALRALLLVSDNDIAVAFTEYPMSPSFISKMNTKAQEIGMSSSKFVEGSGLSALNVSSASDYVLLLEYVDRTYPELMAIMREPFYEAYSRSGAKYTFLNNNRMASRTDRLGGKSGLITASGRTMSSIFTPEIDGKKYTIGIVTLKSQIKDEGEDSLAVLEATKQEIKLRNELKKLFEIYYVLLDQARASGIQI